MLGDLHLLDDLSQRSTIAGTVLAGDANLSCALSLKKHPRIIRKVWMNNFGQKQTETRKI